MNYVIGNEQLKVTISSKGAELQSVTDGTCEYLWQGDEAVWSDRSPVLFPFIGRLYGERYQHQGTTYEIGIHGFMWKSEMETEQIGENAVRFLLTSNEETKKSYPFDFQVTVEYRLEGNRLYISYGVKNTGTETMHFVFGGHPGFHLPLEEGLSFEDYALCLEDGAKPDRILFSDTDILVNGIGEYPLEDGKIQMNHNLFDEDAIILKGAGHRVRLCSEKGSRAVTAEFPDFDYVGFWHMPHLEAGYVCIEPWMGLPGRQDVVEELADMTGFKSLEAGMEYKNEWNITFEK